MQSIATTPTMLGSFFLSLLAISGSASTAQATVLCPGLPEQQYCDCSGDCTGFPEWCGCQEAQECCQMSSPVVLCPDQPRENYCDCDGDCTEQPDWCSCQQAEECCNGGVQADTFDEIMSPPNTVLCPGQPQANYCDCDGDCTEQPDWCSCQQAEECCNGGVQTDTFDEFMSPLNTDIQTKQGKNYEKKRQKQCTDWIPGKCDVTGEEDVDTFDCYENTCSSCGIKQNPFVTWEGCAYDAAAKLQCGTVKKRGEPYVCDFEACPLNSKWHMEGKKYKKWQQFVGKCATCVNINMPEIFNNYAGFDQCMEGQFEIPGFFGRILEEGM
mmetsp:Transcript_29940/g.30440  ORF Transcript_29940/g.30440 Transcript_29940/m.30440 type:complete len:326 (-) Transcript_29940:401-1378(-)